MTRTYGLKIAFFLELLENDPFIPHVKKRTSIVVKTKNPDSNIIIHSVNLLSTNILDYI